MKALPSPHPRPRPSPQGQRGFGLVELMVAVTLGLLLLAGVVQVFASSRQAYRLQQAQDRLQENGRTALQVLARDIRMAGFWGCHGDASQLTNNLDPAAPGYVDFVAGGVDGQEGGPGNPDVLILRGGAGAPLNLTQAMPNASADLKVAPGNGVKQFDLLLVSDCSQGDVFQVTNSNPSGSGQLVHNTGAGQPGNLVKPLSKAYGTDAQVFQAQEIRYSVQPGLLGQPSLFRSVNGAAQELVEGVEDLQVSYGEDTDGDGAVNRYADANDPALDTAKVLAVRLTLTLRSVEDNVTAAPTPFGDRRLRRTFTTTVTLRNRTS
ncbi:MAG: prepilin-type N-terminal cleavage/methylation domain-containing protein [Gammaproteobacteria bacterium]|nr:MAG: prepilin-type N-terminal cleavage/methylation domain-containing protein [Gammaproteobacteria bacterium]